MSYAPGFIWIIWKNLEELVRNWVTVNDSLFVVTGPILDNPLASIGASNVTVPRAFSPLFSITKHVADTIVPMEIIFIEQCVKYNSEFLGGNSKLIDFGVYDKQGKRYRYKITQPPLANTYKQMYYFMENDRDLFLYELTIVSDGDRFNHADSLIKSIAESFIFLK